jgi:murein DD-endopeptidase MepM/ murein hydrolase activator NlpD
VILDSGHGTGYGVQALIDHGFGYRTRYAHLSRILVVPGQEVRRGEVIGEVGNTGRSTGPHLHYEVIYRGQHVDPINYFRKDMTEEELLSIVKQAEATTFE